MSGCLLAGLLIGQLANAAYLRQFSPQGQIDQQVRATAVFSADMVPLGKADAPAPFEVDCGEVQGQSRWSNPKTWGYTLDRPLQAGERCDFSIKPALKALNGEAVNSASYNFYAPGPWPRSMTPGQGYEIEEDQAFLLEASAAVNALASRKE